MSPEIVVLLEDCGTCKLLMVSSLCHTDCLMFSSSNLCATPKASYPQHSIGTTQVTVTEMPAGETWCSNSAPAMGSCVVRAAGATVLVQHWPWVTIALSVVELGGSQAVPRNGTLNLSFRARL
jgi:hypothetical protein